MRICSLLPSATEIVYALGLGDDLVGVTYACDYPAGVRGKPIVVRSVLPEELGPAEIDCAVSEYAARGESIYRVDGDLLAALAPELILTQELCDVCAVSGSHLAKALYRLPSQPEVVALTPHTLEEVWADIETVGRVAGCAARAGELVAGLRARVERVRAEGKRWTPRVACLEWLAPPFNAGHWVPEMVGIAGGVDVLGRVGQDSTRMDWAEVREAAPDVVLVMPCGYELGAAVEEYRRTELPGWWGELAAVREGRVYGVDATAYFSRPGPRLVEGVEMLFGLLQGAGGGEGWVRL